MKQLGDGDRHLTYPDFIERHYDNRTRAVATITTVLAYTAYSAGQFAAAAAILQVLIGWSYGNCLLLAGAIVTLYTAAGGYLAVTFTDRVQVTLVLVGIVAVGIPVAISQAGSWADMRAVLPAAHYDFGAQGWDRVAALVVSMVLSFFVAMDSFSRSFAARDAAAAQRGALLAPVLMLPIALAVAWLGLAAAVLYPDPASSASILATFVLDRFPVGLKGLMVIGILSAVMSVASISVLTASANYARDIHQRYLRPDITARGDAADRHAGLARRRRPGPPARLEDARHHRHPPVRLHAQLGRPLPADDRGAVDGPDPRLRRVLEHERVARDGHRLAPRGGRRRGRHLHSGSALAGALRFGRAADRPDGRAQAVKIVFAEMPEAEGRDLSIERRNLPADARVETVTFLGDRDALLAACRGADAILTDYVPFDRAVLGGLEGCRLISVTATGWDCVDVAAAAERGIRVAAVGEYCTDEVADHTLALLLALNRRLLAYHRQVQVGHSWRWNEVQGLKRLAGQTLGLVGFGRIGQAVGRRALGFGMKVLACDPRVDAGTVRRFGAEPASLDELLARADIISLHSNLDAGSRGLLNRAAFEKMKRKPLLINVARGGLLVEADLVDALDRGLVAGAALDVLAEDSPDLGHHPLVGRPDVLLTPHVAFYSESALEDLRRISASNIREFLEGRPDRVFRLVEAPA